LLRWTFSITEALLLIIAIELFVVVYWLSSIDKRIQALQQTMFNRTHRDDELDET
jgi:hypothetical protein